MRNTIKKITVFLLFSLFLILNKHSYSYATTNVNTNSDNIKNTISSYFNSYFNSLQTLEIPNYDNIILENNNTKLYSAMNELQVEQNKLANLSYQNIKINLEFTDIKIDKNNAEVKVLLNCDYNYSSTPNAKSSIAGIEYRFNLINNNSKWLINNIDSNWEIFDLFKEKLSKNMISNRSALTSYDNDSNTINNIKNELINAAKDTIKYLSGNKDAGNSEKELNTNINTFRSSSYSYNEYDGVNYALTYGASPNPNFYYVEGNDCTNFVSQVLRAAYGGDNSGISQQSRMSSNWYGGSGGGSYAWESVEGLWDQVVNNYPGNGPNGTGYNNNSPYYDFAPSRIYLGEVLQFRNIDSSSVYTHSVYVTVSNNTSNQYYNEILVTQHSDNMVNRNLWELILNKGGNSCYMRDIAFTDAFLN